MHGSVELVPIVGLADAIVDITSTGQTLRDNELHDCRHYRLHCTIDMQQGECCKVQYEWINAIVEKLSRVVDSCGGGDNENH